MQCMRRGLVRSVSHFSIGKDNLLPRHSLYASPRCLAPQNSRNFSSNRILREVASPASGITSPPAATHKAKKKRKPARSPAAKTSQKRAAAKAKEEQVSGLPAETNDKQVIAMCVADEFDMEEVVRILGYHGFVIDPDGTGFLPDQVVHTRGFNNGDIFVFPSGVMVSWSLSEEAANDLATSLLKAAENPNIKEKELEDLEFEEDPQRDHSSLRGDVITLGTKAEAQNPRNKSDITFAKVAFSSGLARSTKLAKLETMLSDYIESTRSIPIMMSQGQKVPLGRQMVMQRTGQLLQLRAQLNHYSELTDSLPDLFWDSPHQLGLESYYDQACRSLDVGVRIKTLNEKMDYAQEIASILRETLTAKHSSNLEWIIIVLILVEVVFKLKEELEAWLREPSKAKGEESS